MPDGYAILKEHVNEQGIKNKIDLFISVFLSLFLSAWHRENKVNKGKYFFPYFPSFLI